MNEPFDPRGRVSLADGPVSILRRKALLKGAPRPIPIGKISRMIIERDYAGHPHEVLLSVPRLNFLER